MDRRTYSPYLPALTCHSSPFHFSHRIVFNPYCEFPSMEPLTRARFAALPLDWVLGGSPPPKIICSWLSPKQFQPTTYSRTVHSNPTNIFCIDKFLIFFFTFSAGLPAWQGGLSACLPVRREFSLVVVVVGGGSVWYTLQETRAGRALGRDV